MTEEDRVAEDGEEVVESEENSWLDQGEKLRPCAAKVPQEEKKTQKKQEQVQDGTAPNE